MVLPQGSVGRVQSANHLKSEKKCDPTDPALWLFGDEVMDKVVAALSPDETRSDATPELRFWAPGAACLPCGVEQVRDWGEGCCGSRLQLVRTDLPEVSGESAGVFH